MRVLRRLVLCALTLTTLSCTADPLRIGPTLSSAGRGDRVRTGSGDRAPAEERSSRIAIARALASALQNSAARNELFQAIHLSPYPEHKVSLRRLLADAQSRIAGAMAATEGIGRSHINALFDSTVEMELYLPVKAHYQRWTGDENLIVATALLDHETPIGYTPNGLEVTLSAALAPETPVLALVPAEVSFDSPPSMTSNFMESEPLSIVLSRSYIPGSYEGWLMGDPEFELHVFRQGVHSDTVSDWRCIGEHSNIRPWDQNNVNWEGSALVLTSAELQGLRNDSAVSYMQVWEDDNTSCAIVKDQEFVKHLWPAIREVIGIWAVAVGIHVCDYQCEQAGGYVAYAVAFWALIGSIRDIITGFQNDDYVGMLTPAWASGATATGDFTIINQDGQNVGSMHMTGFYVPDPPNPYTPPLTAYLNGYGAVAPGQTCTWYGTASTALSENATFLWKRDGQVVSNQSSYQTYTDSSFDLELTIADGDMSGSASLHVSVADGEAQCTSM
jgi:hypothetical protein